MNTVKIRLPKSEIKDPLLDGHDGPRLPSTPYIVIGGNIYENYKGRLYRCEAVDGRFKRLLPHIPDEETLRLEWPSPA